MHVLGKINTGFNSGAGLGGGGQKFESHMRSFFVLYFQYSHIVNE